MGANGVTRSVMSEKILKGASEKGILDAIVDENEEAKKLDPKNGKKAKGK